MASLNTPIPPEWTDYVTQSPIALEVIPDQLYSTGTYTSATTTQITLFNFVGPNLSTTNMTQAGLLPNPQSFLIQAVRIFFDMGLDNQLQGGAGTITSRFNDVAQLVNNGRFVLTIGNKIYGPWKLWTLGAGTYPGGSISAAGAAASNVIANYTQLQGQMFGLFPHLMISPLQNFQVDMYWPSALTLSANLNIECLFDGQRARAVQ